MSITHTVAVERDARGRLLPGHTGFGLSLSAEHKAKLSAAKKGKPRAGYKDGEAILNRCLLDYTSNAQRRGLRWELSLQQFHVLIFGLCHYCGDPPSRVFKRRSYTGEFKCNGVDRVDNDRGYVDGNVVTCCSICNRCKSDMSYDEFVAYLKRAGEHLSVYPFRVYSNYYLQSRASP